MLKFLRNPLLISIILLGLFFRLYKFDIFFQYGHEQDLQAWIVRDVLVNHHFRLIGQETSIIGVFIGPLYYYMLMPFFWLFGMSPLSSVVPITAIATTTLISVYFVFRKIVGKEVGYIASFIYAISLPLTFLDRWAVPTQPTLLWVIWFMYVLFTFTQGDFSTLWILVLLVGLIWYVHIAFIPLLLLVPIAIYLSQKPYKLFVKQLKNTKVKVAIVALVLLLAPFVMFEVRHGYSQTRAIFTATYQDKGAETGIKRQSTIFENLDRVLTAYLFQNYDKEWDLPSLWVIPISLLCFFAIIWFLKKRKVIKREFAVLIVAWIVDVYLSHTLSKRPLEEYYFNNLILVSLFIFSVGIAYVYKKLGAKKMILTLLTFFLIRNLYLLTHRIPALNEYLDRTNAVSFIEKDVEKNNYPCVGINYIGGVSVAYGYRYLFWLHHINLVTPGNDVPVYSVVVPSSISTNEVKGVFGTIGLIPPKKPQIDPSVCTASGRQLAPLNGFVGE